MILAFDKKKELESLPRIKIICSGIHNYEYTGMRIAAITSISNIHRMKIEH